MPPNVVPERQPVSDTFSGAFLENDGSYLLTTSPNPAQFVVRYGLRFLGKPHLSVVPGLVVLDYGDILTGEPAWEFLWKGSNLYPRAEVFGYRSDGVDDMVVVKHLDLSLPPQVLVYTTADQTMPDGSASAIIAPDTSALAPRLLEYLPVYATLNEWQERNSDE